MAQANITTAEHSNAEDFPRSMPTPFLTKTYQLVDDPATNDIISWNDCGSAFVVWRPPEFARDLLPNYFKHNNFSSFVRQLNTYGFKKIVPDRWEFSNDFFKKGERHLLIDIHRRKTVQPVLTSALPSKRSISPSNSADEQAASSSSSAPLSSPRERTPLAPPDETERLKRENMLLASEVSCLRGLCTDLLLYIQKHARDPAQDLDYIARLFHSNSRLSDQKQLLLNKRTFPEQAASNEVLELKLESHDAAHLQKEPPCGKFLTICEASIEGSRRDPPKLFGVPLPLCRRRMFSAEEEQQRTQKEGPHKQVN